MEDSVHVGYLGMLRRRVPVGKTNLAEEKGEPLINAGKTLMCGKAFCPVAHALGP